MFKDNVILWESIREDVKRWVQKNWFQWQFDRPAWLTEDMENKIPKDMIPPEDASGRTSEYYSQRNKSWGQASGGGEAGMGGSEKEGLIRQAVQTEGQQEERQGKGAGGRDGAGAPARVVPVA